MVWSMEHLRPTTRGDRIGDRLVRGLAVWLVLGVLYGLWRAAAITWGRAPGVLVLSVLVVLVVFIGAALVVRRSAAS